MNKSRLVSFAALLNIALLGLTGAIFLQSDALSKQLLHCQNVILHLQDLTQAYSKAGGAVGGYSISHAESYRRSLEVALSKLTDEDLLLQSLVKGDAVQESLFAKIHSSVVSCKKLLQESMASLDEMKMEVDQFRVRHVIREMNLQADALRAEVTEAIEHLRQEKSQANAFYFPAYIALMALGLGSNGAIIFLANRSRTEK